MKRPDTSPEPDVAAPVPPVTASAAQSAISGTPARRTGLAAWLRRLLPGTVRAPQATAASHPPEPYTPQRLLPTGIEHLFASALIGIGIAHRHGAWAATNDVLLRIIGAAHAGTATGKWLDTLPIDDEQRAAITADLNSGAFGPIEIAYLKEDGSAGTALVHGTAAPPPADDVVVLTLDMTPQKELELELRDSEERLRLLIDSADDCALIMLDPTGYIVDWNATAEKSCGYSAEDALGEHFSIFYPVEDRRAGRPEGALRSALRDGRWEEDGLYVRSDGSSYWASVVLVPIWTSGELRGFALVTRDPTRRLSADALLASVLDRQRALEEQLQQAQKMQAIGQLAGGIAHDFNNLLTVIAGHTELLLMRPGIDDGLRTALGEIRDAGYRAAGLTRQLLAFSRRAVVQRKILDLNAVVRDAERMLDRVIGEDLELVTILAPELRSVVVDQGQISQVLVNLALNARDAMPDGGRIIISTANVEIADADLDQHPEAAPGAYVLLSVQDHGSGMTQETASRIFEPFFTANQSSTGPGLGLSMVHGIIRQSGGFIEVRTAPGRGSEFRLFLPTADAAESLSAQHQVADRLSGDETLLVVEDEEQVRRLAVLSLRAHGYTVLEADNGREALRVLGSHEGQVHLVITDVVMPVMGGRQLVEALKPLYNDVRVLYVSGYTDDAVIRHGVQSVDTAFLQKPYTPHALAARVRRMLDND